MILQRAFLFLFPLLIFSQSINSTVPRCDAGVLPAPELPGGSILSVTAVLVANSTLSTSTTTFCNVSITYTHPGQNDSINVWLWLPETWNGRFQGVGGGGWTTGLMPEELIVPVERGYAAVTTDGGHDMMTPVHEWALSSPGNIDMNALQNFASVTLNDMTIIGKQLTEAYYGKQILKSYWNGCSTGGRQGLMMAQRYPSAYDGILANAPAINWAEFIPADFWPQQTMHNMNYFPSQCELNAISEAAINACDEVDGLKDGMVALPGLCNFQTASAVGQPFSCDGTNGTITAKGAAIVQSIWDGPRDANGAFQWYGLIPGSDLKWIANTTCSANGTCIGVPFHVAIDWLQVFIQADPTYDAYNMTQAQWDETFNASIVRYSSIIGTSDPDLSEFKAAGGKMITWHGTADQAVFFNGTVDYYNRVLALDSKAAEFYRFFAAPGAEHCSGGLGAVPEDPLAALVRWVEQEEVPEVLNATRTVNGTIWTQGLCPFPRWSMFEGGDPSDASSYQCE